MWTPVRNAEDPNNPVEWVQARPTAFTGRLHSTVACNVRVEAQRWLDWSAKAAKAGDLGRGQYQNDQNTCSSPSTMNRKRGFWPMPIVNLSGFPNCVHFVHFVGDSFSRRRRWEPDRRVTCAVWSPAIAMAGWRTSRAGDMWRASMASSIAAWQKISRPSRWNWRIWRAPSWFIQQRPSK